MSPGWGKAVWGAMVALALCTPAQADPHSGRGRGSGKLDSALQQRTSSDGLQTVIVTAKPGAKSGVRKRAEAHGNPVLKDHDIINAVTVQVDDRGLAELASDPDVESVSVDADVSPSATTTTDTSTVVSDLKQKLALGNWFTGSSVTIAVIDSGIAPTADFDRPHRRHVRLHRRQGRSVGRGVDEYGHGTHVAGLAGERRDVGRHFGGVAPRREAAVAERARQEGRRQDQRRHRGGRLRGGKPRQVQHPRHQPLARPSDLRIGAHRPAGAGGRSGGSRRHRRGASPRATTGRTRRPARSATPASRRRATPRRRSPSAPRATPARVERGDDRVASFSSRGPSWFDGYAKPDVVAPGSDLLSDVSRRQHAGRELSVAASIRASAASCSS